MKLSTKVHANAEKINFYSRNVLGYQFSMISNLSVPGFFFCSEIVRRPILAHNLNSPIDAFWRWIRIVWQLVLVIVLSYKLRPSALRFLQRIGCKFLGLL